MVRGGSDGGGGIIIGGIVNFGGRGVGGIHAAAGLAVVAIGRLRQRLLMRHHLIVAVV